MLKKLITYENPFTEEKVTEEHFFHLSKSDLIKMDVEEHKQKYVDAKGETFNGMRAKLQRIVDAEDGKGIMAEFEDIIRRSCGKKEGDRFMRSDEIWADFHGSGAYDQLLFEICTDAEAAAQFINGIVPGNLEQIAKEIAAEAEQNEPEPNRAQRRATKKKPASKQAVSAQERKDRLVETMTDEERVQYVAGATSDNPVELTQQELIEMNPSDLQTGLAGGKFKLPGSTLVA